MTPGESPGRVVHRARRRRAARGLASAAGLAAAVVLAVALIPDGGTRPVPPVSPTPSGSRPLVSEPAHVDSVSVGAAGSGASGAAAVAADSHGVWVLNGGTIVQVDPSKLAVVRRVVIGGSGQHLAAGFDSVWAEGAGKIVRIDPDGRAVAEVPVEGQIGGMTAGFGFLWATVNGGDGSVLRIDPATNKATTVVRRKPFLGELGIAMRHVIIAGARDGTLYRLDRRTLKFEPLGRAFEGIGASMHMHAGGFGATVVSEANDGILVRAHELDGIQKTVRTPLREPRDFARGGASSGGEWIVFDSEVIRADFDGGIIERVPLRSGLTSIAEGHGALWVTNFAEGLLYRITAYPLIDYWD